MPYVYTVFGKVIKKFYYQNAFYQNVNKRFKKAFEYADTAFEYADLAFKEANSAFTQTKTMKDFEAKRTTEPGVHEVQFNAVKKRERWRLFRKFFSMSIAMLFHGKTTIRFKDRHAPRNN